MAAQDPKSIPDFVFVGCIVVVVLVIGVVFYRANINQPTGPHGAPPGVVRKQHPGLQLNNPVAPVATNQ